MGRFGSDTLIFPISLHLLLSFVSRFSLWCPPGDTYKTGVRRWLQREDGGGVGSKHPSPRQPDGGRSPREMATIKQEGVLDCWA